MTTAERKIPPADLRDFLAYMQCGGTPLVRDRQLSREEHLHALQRQINLMRRLIDQAENAPAR